MPLASAELLRGRLVYAFFPFAAQFPLSLPGGEEAATIEELALRAGGRPTAALAEARLRPVLLLHDGTRGEHGDVACLRVSAVKPHHRRDREAWQRVESGRHPLFLLLPSSEARYGLRADSLVALAAIGTVHKSAILGPRPLGALNSEEMRTVSERLAPLLSLDLSAAVRRQALRLIKLARRTDARAED